MTSRDPRNARVCAIFLLVLIGPGAVPRDFFKLVLGLIGPGGWIPDVENAESLVICVTIIESCPVTFVLAFPLCF